MLRTGRTAGALGCVVKAPSTLGTFLRASGEPGRLGPDPATASNSHGYTGARGYHPLLAVDGE